MGSAAHRARTRCQSPAPERWPTPHEQARSPSGRARFFVSPVVVGRGPTLDAARGVAVARGTRCAGVLGAHGGAREPGRQCRRRALLLHGEDRVPDDHDTATRALRRCIDGDDNTQRRHSFVGDPSPIEFAAKTPIAAMAASSTCPPAGGKFRVGLADPDGTDGMAWLAAARASRAPVARGAAAPGRERALFVRTARHRRRAGGRAQASRPPRARRRPTRAARGTRR